MVFAATPAEAINMRGLTVDTVVIFHPSITASAGAATHYDVTIYNSDRSDNVTIKGYEGGKALRSEVQGAIVSLFGSEEVERTTTMDVTAYTLVGGLAVTNMQEHLPLTVTPKYMALPEPWYILGNCIGVGTWNNRITPAAFSGLYKANVLMFPNPHNYEQLIYAGYFPDNAEFVVNLEPGNNNKFIGKISDEECGLIEDPEISYTNGAYHIGVPEAGYYEVAVNVETYNLTLTKITKLVNVYDAINMPGTYQGWDVNSNPMAAITKASVGENHDWMADVTFDADADVSLDDPEGIKFAANNSWTVNWGGSLFPSGKGIANGGNIPYKKGNYKVFFNDLLEVYYFKAVD